MPANSASSNPTTVSYAYDGQMGFEDTSVNSGTTSVTDYTLGARGIDRWVAPTGTYFAIYDPHGNQVSFIARNGATFWQAGQRSFDPWGVMRNGAAGFWQPFNRYCGNLGHRNDDESTMVYMGARYYDPGCGRFISRDPGHQGVNLFMYAQNNPVRYVDSSGKNSLEQCEADLAKDFMKVMADALLKGWDLARTEEEFIRMATRDITHWYWAEMGYATTADAIAKSFGASESMGILADYNQQMKDEATDRAVQHRETANLIQIYGRMEMVWYMFMMTGAMQDGAP